MEKFTQGEWEIICSEDKTFMRTACQVSGDCFINSSEKLSDDLLADANLIAAAPEMYRMLQKFIDCVEDDSFECFAYQFINTRELLAKARGEHDASNS